MVPGDDFVFIWDEFNVGHMWDRHGTTPQEVEEAFYNDEPQFTENHPPHKARYIMYGYTAAGGLIVAPFGPVDLTEGANVWRVATAWRGETPDYEIYEELLRQKPDDQTKLRLSGQLEVRLDGP